MTLEDMKTKVYSLIEEYSEDADDLTEDEDLAMKMNSVINQIQNELARLKKIPAYITYEGKKGDIIRLDDIVSDIYQLNHVKDVNVNIFNNQIEFNEDGILKLYYYKYPTQIDQDTDDSQELDLSIDVLEIMPYGVASDLLKSDVSSNYGQIYAQRYQELKNGLDPRYSLGGVYIDGGIEI